MFTGLLRKNAVLLWLSQGAKKRTPPAGVTSRGSWESSSDSDDRSHQFVFRRIPQFTKNGTLAVVYPSWVKNDELFDAVESPPTAQRPESLGGNWTQPWILGPVIPPPDTAIG